MIVRFLIHADELVFSIHSLRVETVTAIIVTVWFRLIILAGRVLSTNERARRRQLRQTDWWVEPQPDGTFKPVIRRDDRRAS